MSSFSFFIKNYIISSLLLLTSVIMLLKALLRLSFISAKASFTTLSSESLIQRNLLQQSTHLEVISRSLSNYSEVQYFFSAASVFIDLALNFFPLLNSLFSYDFDYWVRFLWIVISFGEELICIAGDVGPALSQVEHQVKALFFSILSEHILTLFILQGDIEVSTFYLLLMDFIINFMYKNWLFYLFNIF